MILIQRAAEREELNFASIAEQPLGRFIESFGDMVQHCGGTVLGRALEFLFQESPGSAADKNRTREET